MKAISRFVLRVAAFLCGMAATTFVLAQTVIVEKLTFDTNPAPHVRLAKLNASLYLPQLSSPAPAMVIISSSGGVLDWIEGYYARELAARGIAALVVDSFGPRKVLRIEEDQSLVSSWDMENDAFAALIALRKDARIDGARIGVMGLSKGGLVAQNSAFLIRACPHLGDSQIR